METTIIHHPFRDITLAYDREKPQTEMELATLAQYVELHDGVWKLRTLRGEYEPQLNEAVVTIDELRASLFPIEQQVEIFELGLGLSRVNDLPEPDGTVTFEMDDFYDACDRFHDGIHGLCQFHRRGQAQANGCQADDHQVVQIPECPPGGTAVCAAG